MDPAQLANIVYVRASSDTSNSQGRIVLSEFQQELGEKITAQQIIDAWRQFYPDYVIDQRTENVLIINFVRQKK